MIGKHLLAQLKRHEGFRKDPYICPTGHLSIGYGRNLEAKGITQSEAEHLLQNDIYEAMRELDKHQWSANLDDVRYDACVNFMFNVGAYTFLQFKKFRSAMEEGDWNLASHELLDSRYATQVGQRAQEIAYQIRHGEYPPSDFSKRDYIEV